MTASLIGLGFMLCHQTLRKILNQLKIRPRANAKTLHGPDHEDRDAQFTYMHWIREHFIREGQPIISVDAKKRELIGDFKNPGTTWTRDLIEVNDHDFPDQATAKVTPYGIYDVIHNEGAVVVGESANTAEFAVTAIVQWWLKIGQKRWPNAKKILILADGGSSNGSRNRMWKYALQCDFADVFGLEVSVCHYPPGASKWNPVEHRLFAPITNNWSGIPLRTINTVMDCIQKTTTQTGLTVKAFHLKDVFLRGVKVSDSEMASIDLVRHSLCPSWNYTTMPAL